MASPGDPAETVLPPQEIDTGKFLDVCKLAGETEDGKLPTHALPLTPIYEDTTRQLRKYVIDLEGQESGHSVSSNEKVIMVVGSTGSGKTTILNTLINHLLGVKWSDNHRFKMVVESSGNQGTDTIGNQAFSQTQYVTCYTVPHIEGFRVPYTLTVVDTPGFGDTRGIEQDQAITERIHTFFKTKGSNGIDHIDAICFVVPAGNARLTPTQQYIFDKILSMFGKDIEENICAFFTFADGQKPEALSAMKTAGILKKNSKYFKFNNSALFADNCEDDEDNFDKMLWRMGIKSFEKFFADLAGLKPKSLLLTQQVLDERAQLQVKVSNLREKVSHGVDTLSKIEEEKKVIQRRTDDINASRGFTYSSTEPRRVQERIPTGTFVTHCNVCNYTCHYPCSIPRDEDKRRCAAMTGDYCVECPNKCFWERHVNDQYRMVTEYYEVKKEFSDLKQKHKAACEGKSRAEGMLKKLEGDFVATQNILFSFVAELQRGLQKLSSIALKSDPLQQVDYIDLLIQSEKSQKKTGWKNRVQSLEETKKTAEEINRLAKPGHDPWEDYKENEETRKFLQKHAFEPLT